MRACRWDEADALIAQLDDAPERQAKLRARLNAERRAEAYVGEAGYKSGLEERSARLGNVANKSLCDATRQAAASARETMLATLGEDSVTACDPDTARWAMNQLGSGSGHAQIKALLDKEDRARQALGSYRQARASGNRDAARQAAIDARDNAVCRDTKSAAGSNVDDYNRANRPASAKPTPRRGTGGTSSPGGGGGTGAVAAVPPIHAVAP